MGPLWGKQKVSYKNHMYPQVSKAEIEVFKALSAAGLTENMVTQQRIILKSTVPDFTWLNKRKVVYLDGVQVHSSDKAQQHDEEIDNLMDLQGWDVLRISYNAPLSNTRLQEIMVSIKKFLGSDGKQLP